MELREARAVSIAFGSAPSRKNASASFCCFFDTADIYGGTHSEDLLGRALGARRSSVLVATEFGLALDEQRKGAHPEYVKRALEASLRRLGTDYIDLYQLAYRCGSSC